MAGEKFCLHIFLETQVDLPNPHTHQEAGGMVKGKTIEGRLEISSIAKAYPSTSENPKP